MARKGEVIKEIGRCIYCGDTESLTDEHIIPFALGGNLVLAKASCPACQVKTSATERMVARQMAGLLRSRLAIQTRRPKQRKKMPLGVVFNDNTQLIEMAPEEFPSVLAYPVFAPPRLLNGRPPSGSYDHVGYYMAGQDSDHKELIETIKSTHGATAVRLTEFEPARLMNFVAKVAHCAAAGLLEPGSYKPYLADASVEADRTFERYVGGGGTGPRRPGVLHALEIESEDGPFGNFLIARFTWFADLKPPAGALNTGLPNCAPPSFLAIVGRALDSTLRGRTAFIEVRNSGGHSYGIRQRT
jgi:hypothetical protein